MKHFQSLFGRTWEVVTSHLTIFPRSLYSMVSEYSSSPSSNQETCHMQLILKIDLSANRQQKPGNQHVLQLLEFWVPPCKDMQFTTFLLMNWFWKSTFKFSVGQERGPRCIFDTDECCFIWRIIVPTDWILKKRHLEHLIKELLPRIKHYSLRWSSKKIRVFKIQVIHWFLQEKLWVNVLLPFSLNLQRLKSAEKMTLGWFLAVRMRHVRLPELKRSNRARRGVVFQTVPTRVLLR